MAKVKKGVKGARKGKKASPAKATPTKAKKEQVIEDVEGSSDDEQVVKVEVNANQEDDYSGSEREDEDDKVNGAPPTKKAKTAAATTPAKKGRPAAAATTSKAKGKISKAKKPATKAKAKATPAKKTEDKDKSESEEEEDDVDYEVESILDVRNHRDGSREFQVKWVGYPKHKATWEPEKNLDCPDKLEDFTKKLGKLKDLTPKGLRTDRQQTKPYQDSNRNKGVRASRRFSAKPRMTYHGLDE